MGATGEDGVLPVCVYIHEKAGGQVLFAYPRVALARKHGGLEFCVEFNYLQINKTPGFLAVQSDDAQAHKRTDFYMPLPIAPPCALMPVAIV